MKKFNELYKHPLIEIERNREKHKRYNPDNPEPAFSGIRTTRDKKILEGLDGYSIEERPRLELDAGVRNCPVCEKVYLPHIYKKQWRPFRVWVNQYCSKVCKQTAYRLLDRIGRQAHECALGDCHEQITRPNQKYCSVAHKQKGYRRRRQ